MGEGKSVKNKILEWVLIAVIGSMVAVTFKAIAQTNSVSERVLAVEKFMDEGRRFTSDDGELLFDRIEKRLDRQEKHYDEKLDLIIKLLENDADKP